MAVFTTACASNMTMQTAKALPEGKFSAGGAVALLLDDNGVLSQYSGRPDRESDEGGFRSVVFNPWLLTRYGTGGGCDIGLGISAYALQADLKFQLFNTSSFYTASGLGCYYGYRPNLVDPEPGIHSFDVIIPYYMSYDITAVYSLYCAARYINRNLYTKTDDLYIDGTARRHLVSLTVGCKVSSVEDRSSMFELCISRDLKISYYTAQLNIGIVQEF